VDVAVEVEGEPAAVTTPDRLAQVVDNLLANALEVAPPGSTVRLAAAGVPGGSVEVHVVDAGPGLTREERERAFDRFWRRAGGQGSGGDTSGGSGIGLAIVRTLVTGDGGEVRLDEAPGGGIDAVVRYPAG
jgi:signal transduction histidine kinase